MTIKVVFALVTLFFTVTAFAQSAATEIRAAVKEGETVTVLDDRGQKVKGRLLDVRDDALTIEVHHQPRDAPYTSIVRIDRTDSKKNGALIGLGVGAGFGIAALAGSSCEPGPGAILCGQPDSGNYIATALFFGGIGAALGTGIDAVIRGTRTLYRRPGTASLHVRPVIDARILAGAATVSW
jgi:hypothetical protein